MDAAVEDNRQENVSIVANFGVHPINEEDGDVVVHMEEGELAPVLRQDDPYRVPKI
eukprot:CAMPEP_0175809554 /NCGR_PEP_ID=MMETSP0107_2-20121207/2856_1 /TAXON_ID=195067 ORGANISM="Goniomonas pacifica, Strain CCMP1869" /NCGR_SAMPLE_ID=MMETSP0107_2 /ASSEMBLY_ACC=CAM_ASM_000203 /LENGTH=55 /DNA_ID=CAMNT_0017121259 /DNA_START=230 /DNA_END=397 /DNA_ORIENTATION=-